MYKIVNGTTHGLADAENFIKLINTLDQNPVPEARCLFDPDKEILISRAPGRLDVMGGIADYSGSLVLQLPLKEATLVAIQLDTERNIKIASLCAKEKERSAYFEMALDDFIQNKKPIDYQSANKYFHKRPRTHWAAYVAGAFIVLMKERAFQFKWGARILIHSDVPEGKGVSSSAALEVAAMSAVASAYNIAIPSPELAILCQKVENLIVGAPCGIMDQMTAACGKSSQLLTLLCQPAVLQDPIKISAKITFWGIDSGVRHSVSGADYTSVRIGTFMGYRIIAELAGLNVAYRKGDQHVFIHDTKWNGYLVNITPSMYERHYEPNLPEQIKGSTFLHRYHGTTDDVTNINPEHTYIISKTTAHPIYEHLRVRTFAKLLNKPIKEKTLKQLGKLMYQSHNSYSACGLGSAGTDKLVELARNFGTKNGIYGAKITGGGSGGTVAILGTTDSFDSVKAIAERYAEETGYYPFIFAGSSMGSDEFGHIVLRKINSPAE